MGFGVEGGLGGGGGRGRVVLGKRASRWGAVEVRRVGRSVMVRKSRRDYA